MATETFRPGVTDTHRRLLEAAARVFARRGLEGATTREIAREAKVNEVTLFRHFQSKENLLSAVLQRTFAPPEDASPENKPTSATPADATAPEEFRAGLRRVRPAVRGTLANQHHAGSHRDR